MKDIYFLFIGIFYIQKLFCSNANFVQEDLQIYKRCFNHAIDLFTNFQELVCENSELKVPEQWIPAECHVICKSMVISKCPERGRGNELYTSIRLNISAANHNVYFPTVVSELETKCSACYGIYDAIITCNVDNLFFTKDCTGCLTTKSTMTTGATTSSIYPTTTEASTTTTLAAHSRDTPISTTTPISCPGTESNQNITSIQVTDCKCQNNDSISSSPFKLLETDYDMPVQYVAAAVLVGIIIGVALTLLGFNLRNRFLNAHPRLKDENNVHNPSYDETQRFSNSLSIKASSSKDDEYSEISENNKRKPALREGNDNYDHLNDNFHAKTTDDGTYDHAEYQSRTNIHHQADPLNGGYAQTNPAFADSSYTEVTGEGFVVSNEDISSGPYFVLEEKPCN